EGSNTVGNIAKQIALKVPTLRSLGLDRLVPLDFHDSEKTAETAKNAEIVFEKDFSADSAISPVFSGTSLGAYGRMAEASAGEDSVTGHWEVMGSVVHRGVAAF